MCLLRCISARDYLGCFVDSRNRLLKGPRIISRRTDVSKCARFCARKKFKYAGLQVIRFPSKLSSIQQTIILNVIKTCSFYRVHTQTKLSFSISHLICVYIDTDTNTTLETPAIYNYNRYNYNYYCLYSMHSFHNICHCL